MREILFKAKRLDNGEWIEGGFCKFSNGKTYIAGVSKRGYIDGFEVSEDTICQYTGLTDKNGNKIWENDICSTDLERPFLIVEFRNGAFMYNCNDGKQDYYDIMLPTEPLEQQDKYTEVIGNIFDNKDLLQ